MNRNKAIAMKKIGSTFKIDIHLWDFSYHLLTQMVTVTLTVAGHKIMDYKQREAWFIPVSCEDQGYDLDRAHSFSLYYVTLNFSPYWKFSPQAFLATESLSFPLHGCLPLQSLPCSEFWERLVPRQVYRGVRLSQPSPLVWIALPPAPYSENQSLCCESIYICSIQVTIILFWLG